eukprot:m.222392 g.222392  ORF g.222392 m.222392 type:complete len:110 (+) comp17254_c0_seq3:828-1157(+)
MLTPSITDRSRKVYCCTEAQRQMRGGRYASCPLKPSNTLDLLKAHFPDGRSLNQAIETEFPSTDPFVTQTQVCWPGYPVNDYHASYIDSRSAIMPAGSLALRRLGASLR